MPAVPLALKTAAPAYGIDLEACGAQLAQQSTAICYRRTHQECRLPELTGYWWLCELCLKNGIIGIERGPDIVVGLDFRVPHSSRFL
jgi:hypothetical protein